LGPQSPIEQLDRLRGDEIVEAVRADMASRSPAKPPPGV
jgi:hypothetical protein